MEINIQINKRGYNVQSRHRKRIKKHNINEDIVKEFKQILKSTTEDDEHMLQKLGFATELSKMKNTVSDENNIKNNNIVSEDIIKNLAIKYNLKFLHKSYYIGAYPNTIVPKLREIYKNEPLITEKDLYILAPPYMFNLTKEKRDWFPFTTSAELEPVLFYKVANDKYKVIEKWGKDFTIFRKVSGFFKRTIDHVVLSIHLLLIAVLLLTQIFGFYITADKYVSDVFARIINIFFIVYLCYPYVLILINNIYPTNKYWNKAVK